MTAKAHSPYGAAFFAHHADGSRQSADAVLHCLRDQLGVRPASILDIGCGRGHWLEAARAGGASRRVGVDGEWSAAHFATSSTVEFHAIDLERPLDLTALIGTDRFDLGICVEVVEHLAPTAGAAVVAELASRCELVVFSAAIPGQGGTNHVNEQWPSYWASEFAKHGFAAYDVVRPRLWADAAIAVWYRQNVVLYARQESLPGISPTDPGSLDIVHPDHYSHRRTNPQLRDWIRATGGFGRRAWERLRTRAGR